MSSPRTSAVFVLILLCFSSLSFGAALLLDDTQTDGAQQDLGASIFDVNFKEFKATPTRVYVGEPVTFYANASSDNPGATMTITIYYDYLLADGSTVNPSSPVSVNVTTTPARVVRSFTYDHIGNLSDATGTYFFIRMVAYDGVTSSTNSTKVYVVNNTPPVPLNKPPSTLWPTYQLPLNVSYLVKDWDSEMVSVIWDFGDGSDPALNETLATPEGVYVRQSHTWIVVPEPGRGEYEVQFNMSVSFEDAFGHLVYSNHTVKIVMPFNTEPDFNFTASSLYAAPDEEMRFYANATDPEGDPITWTFVFNNSVEDYLVQVYHTDPSDPNTTVWQNTTHAFPSLGDYSVTLFISDAYPPYQTDYHNVSQTILISVTDNRAPGVLANITMSPTEPRINSTLGYVNVTFSIQANDIDGDALSLSWDFGDGGTASNVSSGGIQVYTFKQMHQFTVAGPYNVSVIVDDGHGHAVLRYRLVSVLTDNRAPRLVSLDLSMSNGVFALPGTPVNVTITISDAEMDPISMWADFGDGSPLLSVNLTDFTPSNTVSTALSHIYNNTGEYNITIYFTDGIYGGTHNVILNYVIEVRVPRITAIRVWNWWDYASLGLVFVGIGLVMLRWYVIGRFRKDLDTKGMTLEEYKVIVKELKEIRNTRIAEVRVAARQGKMDSTRAKQSYDKIAAEYSKARADLRAGKRVEIETGA
jgi:hypothetical protein